LPSASRSTSSATSFIHRVQQGRRQGPDAAPGDLSGGTTCRLSRSAHPGRAFGRFPGLTASWAAMARYGFAEPSQARLPTRPLSGTCSIWVRLFRRRSQAAAQVALDSGAPTPKRLWSSWSAGHRGRGHGRSARNVVIGHGTGRVPGVMESAKSPRPSGIPQTGVAGSDPVSRQRVWAEGRRQAWCATSGPRKEEDQPVGAGERVGVGSSLELAVRVLVIVRVVRPPEPVTYFEMVVRWSNILAQPLAS
jgi:hypothetical protein